MYPHQILQKRIVPAGSVGDFTVDRILFFPKDQALRGAKKQSPEMTPPFATTLTSSSYAFMASKYSRFALFERRLYVTNCKRQL